MVRILHAADFHLDSAFTGLNEQQARQRRQESRDLTRRMVEYANDHGVQLMLLAGDLFDSDSIYGQTAEELAAALAEFRGHVVIAPGNHDCYTAASPYARTLWPDNVLIFTAPEMLSMGLSFPQYGCTVYGAAFTAPEMPESAELAGIAEQDGNVAIGILHGEAGVKDSRYRPIPLQQIAQSGLDYLALGHVHACSGVQLAGKTAYAYPGCPEGRGFDELGDKGFLAGEVDKGSVKLRFVPFAKRRYEIVTVDVTGREPLEAICEALPQHTEADIYRVILTGERSGSVDTAAITDELSPRFYALEVRDRTTVCRDIWDGCGEDSLRGLFLQKMREKYDAAGEDERQTIQQAVRFALSAMANREMQRHFDGGEDNEDHSHDWHRRHHRQRDDAGGPDPGAEQQAAAVVRAQDRRNVPCGLHSGL